jgi:4-diphosphocytidyl-2-C-methyl-D-erythritol kinase
MSLKLFSPAKLNLFFRVLRKREDGFHEIASIYQAISIFDELTFNIAEEDEFTCSLSSLENDNNLVIKSLDLFRKETNFDVKVNIFLKKNIPMQAGLGGGSSNAATTLFALNKLTGNKLDNNSLIKLAAQLGSDVPFFFSTGAAYCTGRGEVFEDINIQNLDFYVVKPDFGISTPLVYKNMNLNLLEKKDPQDTLNSFLLGEFDFYNDLEKSSFVLDDRLFKIKKDLISSGFEKACMTGSGTSFFIPNPNNKPFNIYGVSCFFGRSISRCYDSWWK